MCEQKTKSIILNVACFSRFVDFLDAGIVPDKEHDEFLELAKNGQEVLKHSTFVLIGLYSCWVVANLFTPPDVGHFVFFFGCFASGSRVCGGVAIQRRFVNQHIIVTQFLTRGTYQ